MINNVVLVGRLTKDVDVRYTQSGVAVGSFSVAVEKKFKNANGERETDFINCVIWRKSAENFAKFTRKGSLVGVEGSIQTRNYENNQGQRVYVTEILVNNFSLLESKSTTESRPAGDNGSNASYYQNNQNNGGFNGGQQQSNGFGSDPFQSGQQGSFGVNNNNLEVKDDDMPF